MTTYVSQGQGSFTRDFLERISQCGAWISTNQNLLCYQVFDYFGMHSLFDTVSKQAECKLERFVRRHLELIHAVLVIPNSWYKLLCLLSAIRVPPDKYHQRVSTRSRLLSHCTLAHKWLFLTAPVSRFTSKVYTKWKGYQEVHKKKSTWAKATEATGNRQQAKGRSQRCKFYIWDFDKIWFIS